MSAKRAIKSPFYQIIKLKEMSEAKEVTQVELTIGERLAAIKIFDAFKGSLEVLADLIKDVKQFSITDEEWAQAEKKVSKNEDGTERWNWNEEKVMKSVTLEPATLKYLKSKIKEKSDAGDITLADLALANLNNKLA